MDELDLLLSVLDQDLVRKDIRSLFSGLVPGFTPTVGARTVLAGNVSSYSNDWLEIEALWFIPGSLKASTLFEYPKLVVWKHVDKVVYTLICEPLDNPLLASNFLTLFVHELSDHFRKAGNMVEEVSSRPDEIFTILNLMLPGGQLLFTNSNLHRHFKAQISQVLSHRDGQEIESEETTFVLVSTNGDTVKACSVFREFGRGLRILHFQGHYQLACPPGMVVRGVQRGNWLELIEGQGFMLIVSDAGMARCGDKKLSKRWWAPLECDEYKEAVKNILENIESGVIPEKEGSAMIKRRVNALKNINIMTDLKWKVLATKRRERVEDRQAIENSTGMSLSQMSFIHLPAIKWEQWDIQKHHTYAPIPWQTGRCRDEIATPELETIAKLLQRSGRRQVLWQIAEIAAMLSGPKMIQLLEASIALLDARFEGMARTSQKSSSDVLTPLVELLLLDDSTRDACVAKLMEREDCEFFLLFGASFGRHLSTARQDLARSSESRNDARGTGAQDNSSDVWGWEVIQAAGAFSDINQEVERRFAEMPEPSFCDKVDDPEVETLLSALGRSDNAASAMKVLGPHAGKVKQAKEAVTKMISQLSPPRARVLIRQVMLPKKAGVGLQVAGLKKIVDLRIPDPLELILSKVATSSEFRPEDVRIYFDYFDRTDNPDDQAHVANTLLDQLIEQPEWVLPYLPKVVSKLAMVPGATMKAVQGLTHCTSNVTDVVEALTRGTDGRVLADLISQHAFSPFSDIVNSVGRMSVEECTPETLKEFLGEVLRRWHDEQTSDSSSARACLTCALTVWVKLLRPGQHEVWVKEIAAMESRLLSQGNVSNLGQFAQALAGYAPGMGLSPDETCRDMPTGTGAGLQEKWKVKLAQKLIDSWWARYEEESVRDSKQAAFQQERPDGGWQHSGGKKVSEIVVGSIVSGTVTNSSNTFGVYVNFGCEKDGKLSDRKFVDLLVVGSKGQTVGLEASKKVAQRALSWISGNSELRSTFMVTLQKMLAKLIVADSRLEERAMLSLVAEGTGEEFETSLRLLGPALDAKESVRLVQLVLDQKPASALVPLKNTSCHRSSPEDAVRLWPNLIQTTRDKPQSEDFKTLLKLCEANGLELPKFSQAVSKAMPEEALKSLCASSLPEARLAAIHVLREQHKSGAPPEQLKILCNDQVAVVRAAARDHWVALGGKDEGWQKKKEAQEEEDEDEEGA
eukprot:g23807.t1